MPVLHVHDVGDVRSISFAPGQTLLAVLAAAAESISSGCGGAGTCGLCRVHVISGGVNAPTAAEQERLTAEQLRRGIRLACQVRPCGDTAIRIIGAAPVPGWRPISDAEYIPFMPEASGASGPCTAGGEAGYGVAVDIGTTRISLSLWDMRAKKRLAGVSGVNPQYAFGADVMARLAAASASERAAGELAALVRGAIGGGLIAMAGEAGVDPRSVSRVIIVGNSAMLALLSGRNHHLLLQPANWDRPIDCLPVETRSWAAAWGLGGEASIELVPPLAGFIGSDLLAGILATGLAERTDTSLLVDFGTNSEIALWDGRELWVTSAAGGPAFEGCGISCGMPAEPGAVWRVEPKAGGAGYSLEVIGGGPPKGICGSALVDAVACLVEDGSLSHIGSFTRDMQAEGAVISRGRVKLSVTKRDIDMFQRAKAAIGAGVEALLGRSGLHARELRRVCVCGAFGRFLHVGHAQRTGLLPVVPPSAVELLGNTALAGCERLLFSPDRAALLSSLRGRIRMLNMARVPEFDGLFTENLYLRPMVMRQGNKCGCGKEVRK